jgi:hypothetical protein
MLTNLVLVTCEEKFTRCRPVDILRGIYRERVEISTYSQGEIESNPVPHFAGGVTFC